MDRRTKLILAVIIIVASVLRVAGMFDDFWLDEIWSYYISKQIHNPLDVLLSQAARIDNNHPLNTLFLWLLGEQPNWAVYRIPSVMAGIGSLLLVPRIMLRYGSKPAILATALVGLSYPLIFFSSEARGYSLAVFFALLALDAFERNGQSPSWRTIVTFWAACLLGLVAHLSFVHVYFGLAALTAYRIARARPRQVAVFSAFRLHCVPLLWVGIIYLIFVRKMEIGGAPEQPLRQGLTEAISRLIAAPGSDVFQMIVASVALVLFIVLLTALARRASDWWVMLAVTVILSPAAAMIRQAMTLEYHQPIAARYFVVVLPLVMLAASLVLVELLTRRSAGAVVVVALGAFFGASLWQTILFIQIGRGHYSDAVVYMAGQPVTGALTVISDHPLRTGMVLDFYSRLLPPGTNLWIVDATKMSPGAASSARWLILHSNITHSPPERNVGPFLFDREFTSYGLSGYSWYLYRNAL